MHKEVRTAYYIEKSSSIFLMFSLSNLYLPCIQFINDRSPISYLLFHILHSRYTILDFILYFPFSIFDFQFWIFCFFILHFLFTVFFIFYSLFYIIYFHCLFYYFTIFLFCYLPSTILRFSVHFFLFPRCLRECWLLFYCVSCLRCHHSMSLKHFTVIKCQFLSCTNISGGV